MTRGNDQHQAIIRLGSELSVLPRIRPMRLRLIKEPFDDPDYIFELKRDGFRAVVYIEDGECRLVSRNLKNLRFESLKNALAKLPVRNAIIDGEIVCLDARGVSQFNQLLNRKAEPVLYAFDLLWMNHTDLRKLPLLERKKRLQDLIRASHCSRILYAQHVEGEGKKIFAAVCSRDLEGVVAKRKMGIYREDGNAWLKIKNRSYTQAEGRHELLTRRRLSTEGRHSEC
jgi:bifunctional non-homologous end joining protein LigD